jgi:hypothetical protein
LSSRVWPRSPSPLPPPPPLSLFFSFLGRPLEDSFGVLLFLRLWMDCKVNRHARVVAVASTKQRNHRWRANSGDIGPPRRSSGIRRLSPSPIFVPLARPSAFR